MQLLDDTNTVLTTTQTAADGSFQFSGLDLGTFHVREVLQPGWRQTTANPADIVVTRGQSVDNIDFGDARVRSHPDGRA